MYDVEAGAGDDPTQPAIVNCLDYTLTTIHSGQSVWERRRWFAALLQRALAANPQLRILDVACGGSRYTRDFLTGAPDPGGLLQGLGADWQIFYRDEPPLTALFPAGLPVATRRSANGALAYASVSR